MYEAVVRIFQSKMTLKTDKDVIECPFTDMNSVARYKNSKLVLIFSVKPYSRKKFFKFQTENEATECFNLITELSNKINNKN